MSKFKQKLNWIFFRPKSGAWFKHKQFFLERILLLEYENVLEKNLIAIPRSFKCYHGWIYHDLEGWKRVSTNASNFQPVFLARSCVTDYFWTTRRLLKCLSSFIEKFQFRFSDFSVTKCIKQLCVLARSPYINWGRAFLTFGQPKILTLATNSDRLRLAIGLLGTKLYNTLLFTSVRSMLAQFRKVPTEFSGV